MTATYSGTLLDENAPADVGPHPLDVGEVIRCQGSRRSADRQDRALSIHQLALQGPASAEQSETRTIVRIISLSTAIVCSTQARSGKMIS